MKATLSLLLLLLASVPGMGARDFGSCFRDSTLRIDYTFSGTAGSQSISVDELGFSPGWYGRRSEMDRLLLQGNGQIAVTDTLGRDTLYRHAFSTLFQEWQTTDEASGLRRSFENVFLVPMPRFPATSKLKAFLLLTFPLLWAETATLTSPSPST